MPRSRKTPRYAASFGTLNAKTKALAYRPWTVGFDLPDAFPFVAAGNFCECVEDLQAAGFGKADVFVRAFGGAGEAQDGVAAGDKAVGDGVEDFVVDGVAWVFGACFAQERESEPFADEGDVAGAVEGQSYGL
jgi:hypothetical protein